MKILNLPAGRGVFMNAEGPGTMGMGERGAVKVKGTQMNQDGTNTATMIDVPSRGKYK